MSEALRPLGDLSGAEFRALATAVTGPKSFSLSKEDLEKLRAQISTAANLTFILAALRYLYGHVSRSLESGMQFSDVINAITEELDKETPLGAKKNEVKERLAVVLENREVHQHFRKIQRLQSGFIPNAVGFSSFVDLRPDFGEGDALEIKGYLPVVQFRVSTDATDPNSKRLVFQMSEEALVELRKTLDRTEAKLKAIKEQPAFALQIIKI